MQTEKPIERDNRNAAPLISVIVTIFNVERYVRKCLDSLKVQTLKQIEVICIDDGSTDGSGRIADEYVSDEFPIFKVVHTENRGLSAARNRGLDEARTDWLMFVDSDDWVSEDFCRVPYEAAIENGGDMVIFQYQMIAENGCTRRNKRKKALDGIISNEEAVDVGESFTWNKLYKKELFDGIRYPEGHMYEDVWTTHKVIYKARRILYCVKSLYFYRIRKGSIAQSATSRVDEYLANTDRYQDLIRFGYPRQKAQIQLWEASLLYCGQAADTEDELYQRAASIASDKDYSSKTTNGKLMIKYLIWKCSPKLYRTVYALMGKRTPNDIST